MRPFLPLLRPVCLALTGSLLLAPLQLRAAEGMWTLDNPPTARMRQEIGFAPDAAWLGKAMRASARLAGGCSGSFVSPQGLVLTNHHCVAECVEQLSSAGKDYMKNGFLARSRGEELTCPAMEVNRLEAITDVTAQVRAATSGRDGEAFTRAFNAIKATLTADCAGKDSKTQRCDLVDLYHGGQYKLYRYHRFQDVRLAFAPEQAIAFFGGDPDNFNFPRFDLDMGLLRVYENGEPARVKDFFPFHAQGPAAGEAVFVTGHPGTTQRTLTVAQLERLRADRLPDSLMQLAEYRGRLAQYRTQGEEQARTANAELFYIENDFKVLKGQLEALNEPELLAAKRADEARLRAFVARQPALRDTAGAWDAIAGALRNYRSFRALHGQLERGEAFNSQLFGIARTLVRGIAERQLPNADRLPEFADANLPAVQAQLMSPAPVYPAFEKFKLAFSLEKMREQLGADAALVHQVLGKESPEQVAARLVDGSRLADVAVRQALWDGGMDALRKSEDPFIQLALAQDAPARDLRKRYEREVESVIQKHSERIAQARFAMTGSSVYPDATFTLRLSYGRVEGWKEGDAQVPPFTTMGGTFQRATGADPFALPASWLAARDKLDLAKPFNLVSTNDIIGGNSGSPMLNARGELVGLVFDGNIHSIGGAYWFEKARNRTVAVHAGAIAEAMDKVYGARTLLDELLGR
jgi:hypothetical protein